MLKTVSVLIPAYNSARFVGETLRCVLAQDYEDLEVVVVNDASTDDTVAVVKSFSDPRIKLFHNERNLGLAGVRNRLLELATGDYFAWQDSDDLCTKDRIGLQVRFLDEHPEVMAVGSAATVIDEHGRQVGENLLFPFYTDPDDVAVSMCFEDPLSNSSVMVRAKARGLARFDTEFPPYEDYDFWEQISWHGKLANLPDRLIKYRRHTTQTSSKSAIERDKKYHAIIWRRRLAKLGLAPEVLDASLPLHWEITRGNYWKEYFTVEPMLNWFEAIIQANRATRKLSHKALVNYAKWRVGLLSDRCPHDRTLAGVGLYACDRMASWGWRTSLMDYALGRAGLFPYLLRHRNKLQQTKELMCSA